MKLKPFALGIFSACLFFACQRNISLKTEISIGDLVCLEKAPQNADVLFPILRQCPVLVVGIDERKKQARTLGPYDEENFLPVHLLTRIGRSESAGRIGGATQTRIDAMLPGPNPAVLNNFEHFGLLLKNTAGSEDTVPIWKIGGFSISNSASLELQSCLDTLVDLPIYGNLSGGFLPLLKCHRDSIPIWERTDGNSAPLSRRTQSPGDIAWNFLAKPIVANKPEAPWIFLSTTDGVWVWRMGRGRVYAMAAPFAENSLIENIVSMDLDGDKKDELFVSLRTDYGDGSFNSMVILSESTDSDSKAPRVGTLTLSGSSGEEGGSEVESEEWIQPPYFIHAFAALGNSEKSGGHDTRISAYFFADDGIFTRKRDFLSATFFGKASSSYDAKAWCDSFNLTRRDGLRVHPLPRLLSGKLARQPGSTSF